MPEAYPDGELDIKRLYVNLPPTTCPGCGEEVEFTGDGDGYLSYPEMNVNTVIDWYHECELGEDEWEETEWSTPARIEVKITYEHLET